MDSYHILKTLHILSAGVLFGGGALIAFFFWSGLRAFDKGGSGSSINLAVRADFMFTLPAVILQALTGIYLVVKGAWDFEAKWIAWSISLYLFIGLLWVPVLFIQMHIRSQLNCKASLQRDWSIRFWFKVWQLLGWPAFGALIAIFLLMVGKFDG